nr:hypothetical protein [Verrucosispora sioxanthis]
MAALPRLLHSVRRMSFSTSNRPVGRSVRLAQTEVRKVAMSGAEPCMWKVVKVGPVAPLKW